MATQGNDVLIDYFFGDTNVQRLVCLTAEWRPLQICYPKEVNVSRFLAWLLDPSEGHGLGDWPIQSLLSRAWEESAAVPVATRRFLSPSNVQTESFSAAVVTTEVALTSGSLDILAVDVNRKRFIAIENKFGARQGAIQLEKYRLALEKMFPDFLGIYILLDSSIAQPNDPAWMCIGYDWLAGFLKLAEQQNGLATHVREALMQFRAAIEDEADASVESNIVKTLATDVAREHADVMRMMSEWSRKVSKGARAATLAKLLSSATTLEGKAMLRLFQLYWRRSTIWDDCARQVEFAGFHTELRKEFAGNLLIDAKRVRTTFSLKKWEPLVETDDNGNWFYPAHVTVRKVSANEHDSQTPKYIVSSFIQLQSLRIDKKDEVLGIADALRKTHMGRDRRIGEKQQSILICRTPALGLAQASRETVAQMAALETALATTRY